MAGTGNSISNRILNNNFTIYDQNNTVGSNNDLQIRKSRARVPFPDSGNSVPAATVLDGDYIGSVNFQGFDGNNFIEGAGLIAQVPLSATVTTGQVPADLFFFTASNATSGTATERMIISSGGNVTIYAPDSGVGLTVTAGGETITSGNLTMSGGNILMTNTNGAGTTGIIEFGGYPFISNYGSLNTFIGQQSGNTTLSGSNNTGIGGVVLGNLNTGSNNVAIGEGAMPTASSAANNVMLGVGSGALFQSGAANSAVGYQTFSSLLSGSYNIGIGWHSGNGYTGTESNNILIGNLGTVGESNVMRLGTTGSSTAQVNKAFIAGVSGVTPAAAAQVVVIDTNGQLGTSGGVVSSWIDQTSSPVTLAVNTGYVMDLGSLITATLPATAAFGSIIEIAGNGSGGWLIAQNSGQTIHFGNKNTTTGTGGSLASTNRYDSIRLLCTVANTDFVVLSSIGNITVV